MDRNTNMSHPFSNTVHHTRKHAHTNTGITYGATYTNVYTPYMSGTPARVDTTPMSIFVSETARGLGRALLPVRARWVRGATPNLPRAAGAKAEAEPRAQASAQLMTTCILQLCLTKTSSLDVHTNLEEGFQNFIQRFLLVVDKILLYESTFQEPILCHKSHIFNASF